MMEEYNIEHLDMLHLFRGEFLKHLFAKLIMCDLGRVVEKISPVDLQPDRLLDGVLDRLTYFFHR